MNNKSNPQDNTANPAPEYYGWKDVLKFNLAVLVVTAFILYMFFPQQTQSVVFHQILRNGWYALPWILIVALVYSYFKTNRDPEGYQPRHPDDWLDLKTHRRPLAVLVTLIVMGALWCQMIHNTTGYLTYKTYASRFAKRDGLIPTSLEHIRFTPLENASNDLGNSVSSTGEDIEREYVQPILTKRGFGYVSPITPSGVLNTFIMKNPGFLYLDDSAAADLDPTKRINRINDVQQIGPDMEWMDNIHFVLAKTDFFASFETPHYLALDDSRPEKLTMIVPKIKYGLLWRLPYWGGVVVVHSNGTVEDLTVKMALKDPRFKGKWIYPISLARKYVELQNYGCGWGPLSPFVRVGGKLEVEEVPGTNQFPFLMHGADGKTYHVIATKGEGSARGLFRMYYIDASTGEGSYHEFRANEVVYGAATSLTRLTNIPGYQWYRESAGKDGAATTSGTMIAVEPVYIVKPGDRRLFWKATITNTSRTGISATAVMDASRPDDITVFGKRHEFEAWLNSREPKVAPKPVITPRSTDEKILDELVAELDGISSSLARLREKVERLRTKQ